MHNLRETFSKLSSFLLNLYIMSNSYEVRPYASSTPFRFNTTVTTVTSDRERRSCLVAYSLFELKLLVDAHIIALAVYRSHTFKIKISLILTQQIGNISRTKSGVCF